MFKRTKISKKKNITEIVGRSYALSFNEHGKIKTRPSSWRAAPAWKWSKTSKPLESCRIRMY